MSRRILPALAWLAICLLPLPGNAVVVEMSLPELVTSSDMIVRGEVSYFQCRWDNRQPGLIVADITLNLTESYQGSPTDNRLVITTLGGELGELGLMVEDQPRFRVGQDVVAFLLPPNEQGERYVTNWYHGKYTVSDGRILETGEPATEFLSRVLRAIPAREQR
jgi:hypothetical protein